MTVLTIVHFTIKTSINEAEKIPVGIQLKTQLFDGVFEGTAGVVEF